jgi:hypothetical protein
MREIDVLFFVNGGLRSNRDCCLLFHERPLVGAIRPPRRGSADGSIRPEADPHQDT